MRLSLPDLCLVALVGASGSGKSTFANRHFLPTEVVSSDFCRALVSDDENSAEATNDAFELLHYIANKRLSRGKLTVVDATNVQRASRAPLVQLARAQNVLPVAIVLNMPEALCLERNANRDDRTIPEHAVRRHVRDVRRSIRHLKKEGFRRIFILNSPKEVAGAVIEREPLWNNLKHLHGPFDLIGDIHGCTAELEALLAELGYDYEDEPAAPHWTYHRRYFHPAGRQAVFLGDLTDRGPRNLDAYQLVRRMVEGEAALCVPGNHDVKVMRLLNGRNVKINHGLEVTKAELEALPPAIADRFKKEMHDFIRARISHYLLDDGKLVVAHAGLKEDLQGRASGHVRGFALYGETTGEVDEFGLPVRFNWAAEYRGKAMVAYGHTPVYSAEWLNNTICLDTGCVFGHKLTAMRYPEKTLVSVPALETYAAPSRPLIPAEQTFTAQQQADRMLDIADVIGKLRLETRLLPRITIREENSTAALEVMTRFAADPRWLIYLPPTMSPAATSELPAFLEHPEQAFNYYRKERVDKVICEEKHMGSRAVAIVCRDTSVPERRFGVQGESLGIVYTRTGRSFFDDTTLEQALLAQIRDALTESHFWNELETDWVCLDCELMPWSTKAQSLLQEQYAAVGAAATAALADSIAVLQQAAANGAAVAELVERYESRLDSTTAYINAYRTYCWPVASLADLRLAPFHILATEGHTHIDKDHGWHMGWIEKICAAGAAAPILFATQHRAIDLNDPEAVAAGVNWWLEMTAAGGEGMVVKPWQFINHGPKGVVQPAIKIRGREYLRIIYGPEYTDPANLERLRQRGVNRKRSLASREFALGIEALERFVSKQPLRRVHECVFAILALESEPVDPRL